MAHQDKFRTPVTNDNYRNNYKMIFHKPEVVLVKGCMFAGKTTHVLNLASKKSKDENKSMIIVKPPFDTRCDKFVTTHDGRKEPAITIRNMMDAQQLLDYDIIVFDEVQFFAPEHGFNGDIVQLVKELSINDKSVYMAGLDYWHTGKPVDIVIELARQTRCSPVTLTANCCYCNDKNTAVRTLKTNGDKNAVAEVGSGDKYIPVCIDHFNEYY